MPQAVVAAVVSTAGTAIGTAIATGTTSAITTSLLATTFFTTLAVGAVGLALQKKPKPPEFAQRASGLSTMVRQPLTTGRVLYGQVRVSGPLVFVHTTNNNKWLHLVIPLACHEVNQIGDIYFEDEVITLDANGEATDSKWLKADGTSLVRVKKYTGADGQTADTDLIADAPDKWTSNHRLRGNAYIYVRLGWKQGTWPNGIPNISAVVQGKKLYDTRDTTTTYNTNPALAIYDYLTNSLYGLNTPAAEIDTDSFDTAANVCDESVALVSGSEDRYTVNGVADTAVTPKVIIEELLSSMAGSLTYQNGKWFIYAGEYRTPTVTLDETDLRGGIEVTTRISRKDLFNTVKGIYIDPSSDYQPVDFPEVTNSTYVTEDNSDIITHDTTYPFTTSEATAQRLAKIELERVRQQIQVQMPLKMTGFQLQVGDNVQVTNARFGWNSKVFEVTDWVFVLDDDGQGGLVPGVNVSLRETASSVWSWSAEETTVDTAPDTDLPNPFTVSALTGLALDSSESQLIRGANGRIVTRIKATWDPHSDSFVKEGGRIEAYYKKSADSVWIQAGEVNGSESSIFITDVDDRSDYDVRIRAVNVYGGTSAYTTVSNHTVIGKTTPPPNVSGFYASTNLGLVRFSWDQIGILDIYGYEIRYGESGIQWKNATPLTIAKQGTSESTAAVPPGTWSFLIKAVDYVGLYSNAAAVASDITVSNANSVLNAVADGAFPGTLDNFVLHYTSVLVPDDQNTADTYGWSTFDVFVPVPEQICTYTSTEIDLGSDQTVRVWGDIESSLGPGVTSGVAAPKLQVCYRSSTDSSSGGDTTTDLISSSGTLNNCILHYTNKIVPDSQSLANATSNFEVFDNFVYDAFETATYESPEVDYGSDGNLLLSPSVGAAAGPGETGSAEDLVEIDTRTSSGSYDGYEAFNSGTFNLRYAKVRLTLTNTTTVGYISNASLVAGCWRDWIIGDINNVRYINARIREDTDVGIAKITDFNWTIDQ